MASLTKKIGEGTLFITSQRFITTGLSILTSLLVIKYLGQYQYGILVLAMSIVAMVSTFLDFGIGIVITSDIANYIGEKSYGHVKRLIKDYFWSQLILGSLWAFLILILTIFLNQTSTIKYLVYIAAGMLFIMGFKNVFLTVLNSFSYFKLFALIQVSEILVKFILLLIFVVGLGKGLIWIMLINFLSSLSVVFIGGLVFLKIILPLRKSNIANEHLLFDVVRKHGKWQIVYQILKSSSENLRYWVITFFVGVNGVAIYNVAIQIISHLTKFTGSLEAVLLPVLSEELARSKELAKKIIDRSIKYSLWLVSAIMLISSFVIPYFLVLFFGDKYLSSIPVFQVMLFALPTSALGVVFRPIFFYFKEQKSLFFIGLKINLHTIPISVLLTYFLGVFGYAIPIPEYYGLYLRYQYLKKKYNYLQFDWKGIVMFDDYDKQLLSKIFRLITNKFKKND